LVEGNDLAAFQARADLLAKYLKVLPQVDSTVALDTEREAGFQKDLQQCLALGRGLKGDALRDAGSVWQGLAEACAAAGRREEKERVDAASLAGTR
jgi:hypothetical protein